MIEPLNFIVTTLLQDNHSLACCVTHQSESLLCVKFCYFPILTVGLVAASCYHRLTQLVEDGTPLVDACDALIEKFVLLGYKGIVGFDILLFCGLYYFLIGYAVRTKLKLHSFEFLNPCFVVVVSFALSLWGGQFVAHIVKFLHYTRIYRQFSVEVVSRHEQFLPCHSNIGHGFMHTSVETHTSDNIFRLCVVLQLFQQFLLFVIVRYTVFGYAVVEVLTSL